MALLLLAVHLATVAGKSSSPSPSTEKGKLEPSISQNEAAALEEMIKSVLGSLEKMIAREEFSEEEEDELISSIWIYFTDSGAMQLQFHELLSILYSLCPSVILISWLSNMVDDHPPGE